MIAKCFYLSRNLFPSFGYGKLNFLQMMIILVKKVSRECSVKVLKLVSLVFVQPLMRLINLSIQSGCFPTKWKMAHVTPLFKDGAQDCQDNFRPISMLSILSKVCEKHVAASFMDYLVKTGLLYEILQSAFRTGYSTESALISLTDQILFSLMKTSFLEWFL